MASQTNTHILTGKLGEESAATYLKQSGYTILRRNYRYKRAEIDVIAQKEGVLVFVEVKTRATDIYGFPEEAVSRRKTELLLQAAEVFIEEISWVQEIRFDIISITLKPQLFLHHIEDAFY